MPKILNPEANGLSDQEQMIMALYSEGHQTESLNPSRKLGYDITDDPAENRKSGFLDSIKRPVIGQKW